MKLPTVDPVVAVSLISTRRPAGPHRMSDARPDPADEKASLRKSAALSRAALAAGDPDAAERLAAQADILKDIASSLAEEAGADAPVIAAYLPIRSELSPLPLVATLAAAGMMTAMPVTPSPGNPLSFRAWAPGDALADGPYNTQQPPPDWPEVTPNVILAPMLAFDDDGWRLGYGGGFYDRTLAGLRAGGHRVAALGIAYDGQHVEAVPTGPYDMRLDGVLTPSGLRLAEQRSGARRSGE